MLQKYFLIENDIREFISEINKIFNPNKDDCCFGTFADFRLDAFWKLMKQKDEWLTENCPDIKDTIMDVINDYEYEWKIVSVLASMNDEIQLRCSAILRQ